LTRRSGLVDFGWLWLDKETLIVAKIPTPFIGGAESPRRGSDEDKALQLPFSPQEEGAVKPEAAPADVDEQAPPEQPIRIEVEAVEAEEPLQAEPAEAAAEAEEPLLAEPAEAAAEAEEPLLAESAETEAEPAEPEALETDPETEEPVAAGGLEVPDFLFGPDSAAREDTSDPVPAEEHYEAPDELAEMARALQEGKFGDRIRELINDLGDSTPDSAVPRAFAAGYLAAKKLEEE
jgi:hypothetical protein